MTKKGGAGKAGLNREILANAWGYDTKSIAIQGRVGR